LVSYLWENYIDVESRSVFLLGIGSGTSSLVHLLNAHERTTELVKYTFSFISEHTIFGVNRPADDYFPGWYFNHSTVYIAHNHHVWSPDRQRKQRKKYGNLIQSNAVNLSDMVEQHRGEVFAKMLEEIPDLNSTIESQTKIDVTKVEDEITIGGPPTTNDSNGESLSISGELGAVKDEVISPSGLTSSPLKSPSLRLPPVGVFNVTTPERRGS